MQASALAISYQYPWTCPPLSTLWRSSVSSIRSYSLHSRFDPACGLLEFFTIHGCKFTLFFQLLILGSIWFYRRGIAAENRWSPTSRTFQHDAWLPSLFICEGLSSFPEGLL